MASQSDGLYYDFTKTDRLFQENTGPTPAQATNDVIGLALDQRTWRGQTLAQVLAGASELVTNGTFNTDLTGWTDNSLGTHTSAWQSGVLHEVSTDASNYGQRYQAIATVAGHVYRVSIGVTVSSGSARVFVGTAAGGTQIANFDPVATSVQYFAATGTTTYITLRAGTPAGAAGDVTFDNISCKQVSNYAATQSTSSLRATYQSGWARYDGIDDRHNVGLLFGSKGFVMARRKLIQKTASTQIMFGAVSAAGTDRLYFGVDTNGIPVGRIGNGAAMSGSGDITGVDGTIGVMWDSSNASLLVDGAQVVTQTQTNAPTTTVSPIIGGYNNNGTAGSFCNFDCREIVNGNSAQTAATLANLHRALMAI